jgi:hypothetical protein
VNIWTIIDLLRDPVWAGVFNEAKRLYESGKFNPADGKQAREIVESVKRVLHLIKDKTGSNIDNAAAKWLDDFLPVPQMVGGPIDDLLDAVKLDAPTLDAIEAAVNAAATKLGIGGIFLSIIIEIVIAILRKLFGV